jgi:DNA-binding transcriptional LysR family regulator
MDQMKMRRRSYAGPRSDSARYFFERVRQLWRFGNDPLIRKLHFHGPVLTPPLHSISVVQVITPMQKTDADHLDLRTLRLLAALLEMTSVSRAAESMGMSQPAASRTVARLRSLLDDPLLVRTRAGYTVTRQAEVLRPRLEAAIVALEALLSTTAFDPASTPRRFRVATTDYGAATVMAAAARHFTREAPQAVLEIVPFGSKALRHLERGTLDLALWADSPLPPDFHFRRLFTEHYACVFASDHPLVGASSKTLLRKLSEHPHLALLYPSARGLAEDDALSRLGVSPLRVAVRTAYYSGALAYLRGTSLILCVPSRMAVVAAAAAPGLTALPLPTSALAFEYRTIWHERMHRDPGCLWLRALVKKAAIP